MISPTDSSVGFAAKLLELIGEASTTTTYKYALLLALVDLCQENVGQSEGPVGSVTTRQVARRVVEIYWPQTRTHSTTGRVLRQLTRQQRSIPDLIAQFRSGLGERDSTTPHRAETYDPSSFGRLLDEVEWILIRYPIPLLQRVGKGTLRLIYEVDWDEQPPRGPVTAYQRWMKSDESTPVGSFDNRIRFLPGVEEHLASLSGLFRPLIQREWSRFVLRCNGDALEDLEEFLFDPTRDDLSPVRQPLLRLQRGLCFYCRGRIQSPCDVDHFLPWARCGDDRLHNLVVAHRRCNSSKRDHLAGTSHLGNWYQRLEHQSDELQSMAEDVGWPVDLQRSLRLARSLYCRIAPNTPLWVRKGEFEQADPLQLGRVLLGCPNPGL